VTGRASFEHRLRTAQELNAASEVRSASRAYQGLLHDLSILDPDAPGSWVVEIRVRALLGEAFCIYVLTGDLASAQAMVDKALEQAQSVGDPRLTAVARGQEGVLHLRAGDAERAMASFDAALSDVDPQNHRDLAVLRINRGAACSEAGRTERALEEYEQALEHAVASGLAQYVSILHHNIGMARFEQGDIPGALEALDASVGDEEPAGWAQSGRAVVLLGAGLVTEAERVLADSASILETEGLIGERADALLERARCALLLRRFDEAVELAETSRLEHLRAENVAWSLHAAAVALQARLGSGHDDREQARQLLVDAEEVARLSDEAGPVAREPGLGARMVVAECALLLGDLDGARRSLSMVPARPDHAPLSVRVQHQAVLARVAFAADDRRAGLAAVRRGHRLLADHRARIGSVDVLAAAAAHGVTLAQVDVAAAFDTGLARVVFDAAERGRAAFAGAARVRPPQDPELADLLVRARRTAEAARELAASGDEIDVRESVRLSGEVRRLQERARQRSWQLDGAAEGLVPRPATTREVTARLATEAPTAAVVSFLLRDRVTAVRVDARGARLVELSPHREVTELARRVRQDLEVLSNRLIPAPMRQVAATSARRSLTLLDDLVLAPLEVDGPLYVAARDGLLSLPWSAMPSRGGLPTQVHSWVDLRESKVAGRRSGVLVVGGPGLDSANREAALVAGEWDEAVVLTDADATCAATTKELSRVSVVHVAAHGVHEPDNPLFSFVRLADGPLFAHELDGIDLAGVVVVLSACEVGRASTRVGGEPLGLKSVLLRLGARAVIASVAPLRDDVAAQVMPRLHAALAAGAAPAHALAAAVADEPEPVPLVCYGPVTGR
jgi:hypothetical protein